MKTYKFRAECSVDLCFQFGVVTTRPLLCLESPQMFLLRRLRLRGIRWSQMTLIRRLISGADFTTTKIRGNVMIIRAIDQIEMEDSERELVDRIAESVDSTNNPDTKRELLEILVSHLEQPNLGDIELPVHSNCPENVIYSGDVNPVDHDGVWANADDWKRNGYANCVRVQSAENKLWIEQGVANKYKENTPEKIAEVYGIDPADVTLSHEIDYAISHWGIEVHEDFGGRYSEEYTRLDTEWFLDSDGDLVSETELELRLCELVGQLAK